MSFIVFNHLQILSLFWAQCRDLMPILIYITLLTQFKIFFFNSNVRCSKSNNGENAKWSFNRTESKRCHKDWRYETEIQQILKSYKKLTIHFYKENILSLLFSLSYVNKFVVLLGILDDQLHLIIKKITNSNDQNIQVT